MPLKSMANQLVNFSKGEKMRREIKKGFYRFLMFGLAIGTFAFQADAQRNSGSDELTGTYRLDISRSENVNNIVQSAARNNSLSASEKVDLEDKLKAPETISIDVRGNQVTISSSKGNPVTLTTDGRRQNYGSNTSVSANLRNNILKISTLSGDTDYSITFTTVGNGGSLQVTRMITGNNLRQTVFADSFYNRTDSNARVGNTDKYPSRNDNYPRTDKYPNNPQNNDDGYSSSDSNDAGYSTTNPNDNRNYPDNNRNYPDNNRNYPGNNRKYPDNNRNYPRTTNRNGNFYVPNGTVLTGTLENNISTKASQNNDRFRLTLNSPGEYQGAIIEGYLSGIERTGKISGSSKLTLNFERIQLRNGQTYDFAGVLQTVTDAQGKIIDINAEGQVKGDNRTKETIKRGGIGAGLGAIIGGIIGGGKGAIIGATIGGAGGAGSVAIEDKDDLELLQGSQITVQSTSPNTR